MCAILQSFHFNMYLHVYTETYIYYIYIHTHIYFIIISHNSKKNHETLLKLKNIEEVLKHSELLKYQGFFILGHSYIIYYTTA